MDQQAGSPDPTADTCAPAEHLRPVPSNGPAAPPHRKKGPGPKTPRGKARVRLNAVRSGIHALSLLIPGERPEDLEAHQAGILASVEPANYLQTYLAVRMASLSWRLNRITSADTAEFARANTGHQEFRLPASNELDKITKTEAHLSRQFYQAKHELEVLQKQGRGEATPLVRLDVQGAPEQSGLAPESGVYDLKTITPLNP